MDEGRASTGGINVEGDVSGTGIIIGKNIKTGDISINVVYETIRNFGLTLLPSTYFKDNQKTDENFEKWKKGFPLRLPSVMKGLEFRRDRILKDIKNKLKSSENSHRLLLLGKPGSSKSTILMEIICDYFKDGYQILYNWENTNKIGNTSDATQFISKLLDNDNKILIAVDNVHTDSAVGIFPIIGALSSHNKRENLTFILTARTPDYERFLDEKVSRLSPDIKISVQEIDDKSFRHLLPRFTEREIEEFIKHYSNEKEVQKFIRKDGWSLSTEDDCKKIASFLYEKTAGDPIRIRFLVFGKGLALDARLSYDDYLRDDVKKLRATLVCSLLDLANYAASEELFEGLQLSDYAIDLEQESILEFSEGAYRTKHPSWDLELLSYMFNVNMYSVRNRTILQDREQILKDAANLLFDFENPKFTKSVISAAYDATRLETEGGGRVPIDVIERTIEIPKNLDSNSKYDIYTYFIGHVYRDLKMYQKALICYDKAIELYPFSADVWNNKGITLDELGKLDEANTCFDTAIEIDPLYDKAFNNKGNNLRKLGRYDEAFQCMDKAIEIVEDDAYYWDNKGLIFKALNKFDEAIICYDKAIHLDPNDAGIWRNKGEALSKLGKYDAAIECFDKAIHLDPNDAIAWYSIGFALHKSGNYTQAIQYYDKALAIDTKDIAALGNKGISLHESGNYTQAIHCYDEILAIDPNNLNSLYNKGLALDKSGNYTQAIQYYDKALAIDTKYIAALRNKGLSLVHLGNYDAAIECFDKAIHLDPNDAGIWHNKASALGDLERHDEAIECYDQATKINPNDAIAWHNKGTEFGILGNYDAAIECFDKALEINPNYDSVLCNKDLALRRLGRYADAEKCFEKRKQLRKQKYEKSLLIDHRREK